MNFKDDMNNTLKTYHPLGLALTFLIVGYFDERTLYFSAIMMVFFGLNVLTDIVVYSYKRFFKKERN